MHIASGILVIIFIGLFIWFSNLGFINLARDWPLILVVVGVLTLLTSLRKGKKRRIIEDLEKGRISVEEAEEKLKHS